MEVGRLSLTKPRRTEYVARLADENKIRISSSWEITEDATRMSERTVYVYPNGPAFREPAKDFPSEFLVTQLMLVIG